LLFRYFESRERLVGWWAVAYISFTAHIFIEALLVLSPGPILFAVRHVLFIAAAWAMVHSFRSRPSFAAVAAGGALLSIVLAQVSPFAGAIVSSVLGGVGFIASAWFLYQLEGGLQTTSAALLFWGLLLTGVHALDYPFIRSYPPLVGLGAAVSGVFTLLFGVGMILWALRRTRDLTTMNVIAETLNRSPDVRSALTGALDQIIDLMRLQSGWVLLQKDGAFQLQAARNLPSELAANNLVAMEGDCRCLQMLREGQLTHAVNLVNCMRLEKAGVARPRHATIPIRSSSGVAGVMNLVLSGGRRLTSRELITLSLIGHEVGLAVDRARLFEEVRDKEERRGELLQKLITAYEDERRRIARGLHDEAGQSLTALILNLEMAEQTASPSDQARLARLRGIAEDTLTELRRVIYGLRPAILDDLGLAAAIRWYVRESVEPQGLHVAMTLPGLEIRLPSHVEIAVFRIVQETLTNVLKHANARQVTIDIAVQNGQVRVTISDDGHGFEPTTVRQNREGRGLGLLGMRERAELLGGRLDVTSRPGVGTRVDAMIPVEHRDGQN
jgi:signal transduction histidine kinase